MKDLCQRLIVIILWILFIILAAKGKPVWLILLIVLHICELLLFGYNTGRKYGKGILETLVCCMVWGFLWWLPMKKLMKRDELTDEDFVEDGLEPWREKW